MVKTDPKTGERVQLEMGWRTTGYQDPYFSWTLSVTSINGEWSGRDPDMLARIWPEFVTVSKWHLVSTIQPMHYVSNSIYHRNQGHPDSFRSCCIFGALPTDEASFLALENVGSDAVTQWLVARLPALIEALHSETTAAGFPAPT